jgi:type I restriction enzyme S subunit
MKLETFFEKFDELAHAPDSVDKMRELILESAIRGKLVLQDTCDEPASELLKRVAFIQDGQSKKRAALAPVGDDAYLELPTGWEWTRLGNTGRIFNGDSVNESGKAKLANVMEGLPFIATKDVGYGRDMLVYDNGLKVPRNDPSFKVARATAVLICAEGGSAGRKIGITDRDICFGNKLYANEVWEGIHPRYVFYVYQAPTFFKEFASRMTGIIGGIARSEFLSLPIPLPPVKEQKRIVAKVDELMALCDQLEAQQQERKTRHAALARASLARFADEPTPANLSFLFHPSYAIPPADLRKSILTLAFAGKLVSQNPNDEPASVLLEKARTEKARLIEAGLVKKEPWADKLKDATTLYELPSGWEWTHVSDVVEKVTVGFVGSMKAEYREGGVPFLRCQNVRVNRYEPNGLTFVSKEFHRSISKSTLRPGDVVVTRSGNVGVTCVIPDSLPEANCSDLVIVKRPLALMPAFLSYFINSIASGQIEAKTVGIALTHFNTQSVAQMTVALPPFAEQRRIVAKVEQLMALVDELETQLAGCYEKGQKLLEAIVSELTLAS